MALGRLTIDKISLTLDVPELARDSFLAAFYGRKMDVEKYWGCEVYAAAPLVGYTKCVILEREGEKIRVDFDPRRTTKKKLTDDEVISILKFADPFLEFAHDEDGGLCHYDIETGHLHPIPAQYNVEPVAFARVEFNPDKFPGGDAILARVISKLTWKNPREGMLDRAKVTRIDSAVDYDVNISTLSGYRARTVRGSHYYGNGETFYFDAPTSPNRVKMYDKAAERMKEIEKNVCRWTPEQLAAATKEWSGKDVTRIEAMTRDLRGVDGRGLYKASQVSGLRNPFKTLELKVMNKLEIDNTVDWRDVMVACGIEQLGLDAVLKMMPRRTRTRYRKMFQEGGVPIIDHPAQVFDYQFVTKGKELLPCLFDR